MSRKTGFDYYAIDTNRYQDIKIKKLKKNYGRDGVAIYDYILCEIYRIKGCFLEWDESTVFDVADYWGVKETLITEIVNYCCSVGLFNKELLDSENILSSNAIISRFTEWSTRAKRNFQIPEKLIKLPEKESILPEKQENLQEETTQSKVKESKEKKSKVNRAYALVVRDDGQRREVKEKYKTLLPELEGKEKVVIWKSLKEFVCIEKPDFIEPYVDAWNVFASTYKLPEVKEISDSRRRKFETRRKEEGFEFLKVLEKIKTSPHLKGDNNRGWKVNFDFLLDNDKNYLKILEGQYD